MATEDVKLLSFWASPFVMRAILALEAKGVRYELIDENLKGKSGQLLLESNPVYKKIPVLLHNGKAISESLVIVQYVDEAWPEHTSFFPKDPYGRAMTRFWSDFIEKKIFDVAFRAAKAKAKGEEKEVLLNEVYNNFLTLESGFIKLDAKPFLNAHSIGYADICLAPLVAWLSIFVDLGGIRLPTAEETPHLHKFIVAIREHPAAKVTFPDQEKLVAFSLILQQRWAAST